MDGGIEFYKECIILALFLWDASEVEGFMRGAVDQQRKEAWAESGEGF